MTALKKRGCRNVNQNFFIFYGVRSNRNFDKENVSYNLDFLLIFILI